MLSISEISLYGVFSRDTEPVMVVFTPIPNFGSLTGCGSLTDRVISSVTLTFQSEKIPWDPT